MNQILRLQWTVTQIKRSAAIPARQTSMTYSFFIRCYRPRPCYLLSDKKNARRVVIYAFNRRNVCYCEETTAVTARGMG